MKDGLTPFRLMNDEDLWKYFTMKHPTNRLERLYINAKKDRRKKRKDQENVLTETEDLDNRLEHSEGVD